MKIRLRKASHFTRALVLMMGSLSAASPAAAQFGLQWEAPLGCPQRAEVMERIRAIAGSSLDKNEGLSAEGRISREERGYLLTILVRDGAEVRKRVIESDSCSNLGGAAAVALAFLLEIEVETSAPSKATDGAAAGAGASDKRAVGAGERASADAQAENEQPAVAQERADSHEHPAVGPERADAQDGRGERTTVREEPAHADPSPTDEPSSRRWAALLQAPFFVADFGPLPRPMFGVGLGVGLLRAPWRVLGAAQLYAEQDVAGSGTRSDLGARVSQARARLAVCHAWRSRDIELSLCLGMTLGYVRARGFGEYLTARTATGLWLAPSAGPVGYWYALKSLAFFAGATGSIEVSRPELVVEGAGTLGKLAPISASLAVGAEWIF